METVALYRRKDTLIMYPSHGHWALIILLMELLLLQLPVVWAVSVQQQQEQQEQQIARSARSAIYDAQQSGYNKYNNKAAQLSYKLPNTDYDNLNTDEFSRLQSYNLLSGSREDICKHCLCENVNKFRTVHCDYRKNHALSHTFGANFEVPNGVTAITIRLAPTIKFVLQDGFFHNNIVNSFTIEGSNADDQVELAKHAFNGNKGGYPDIKILNVQTVFVRTGAFSAGEIKFKVQNSAELILYTNAFSNVNMTGSFVGIQDMNIHEKTFNSAHARLRIENSGITEITRFEASVHEIRFINCKIGIIRSLTFDVTNINFIVFENCRIETIETRAITAKLHSDHVSITGAVIGVIDSEAIYGSGISELVLTHNTITSINAKAITVHSVNVTIAQNEIKHLGNDWLTVKDWSKIIVEQNKFGKFGGMSLQLPPQQPADCSFSSNSLTEPQPGSLNIRNCRFHEISIKLPCSCNLAWLQRLSDHDLRSETYCLIEDQLSYCFNASVFNTLKYVHEVCDEQKTTLDCVANRKVKKVNGQFFTPEELEQNRKIFPLIIICAGIIFISTLCFTIIICRYCSCRRHKALMMMHNNNSSSGNSGSSGNSNRHMNVDNAECNGHEHLHDFTAEDRHIIEQTMQMLQKKYPDIYKSVNDCTRQLLRSDLTERRCAKLITKIVTKLDKYSNEDFIQFSRVLSQHLQTRLPTAPPADPIYTEPTLADYDEDLMAVGTLAHDLRAALTDGGDYYTSSAIVIPGSVPVPVSVSAVAASPTANANANAVAAAAAMHNNNNNNSSNNNNNINMINSSNRNAIHANIEHLETEPIYAEPNVVRQALLRNEYASPADRHLDNMDLYTEPVYERDHINLPPAYEATERMLLTAIQNAAHRTHAQQQHPQHPQQPQQQKYQARLLQYAVPKRVAHAKLLSGSNSCGSGRGGNTLTNAKQLLPIRTYNSVADTKATASTIDTRHNHNNNSNNNNNTKPNVSNLATHRPETHVRRLVKDLEALTKFKPKPLLITTTTSTATTTTSACKTQHSQQQQQSRNLHMLTAQPPVVVYAAPHATTNAAIAAAAAVARASKVASAAANAAAAKRHNNNSNSKFLLESSAADAASSSIDMCQLDMRGATALPLNDSGSNHSGGSNETVKIDDVIVYADA